MHVLMNEKTIFRHYLNYFNFLQYPLNGEVEDGGTVTVTGPGSWSLDTMCVDWDNDNNLVVTCGLDITAVNTDTQVVPQID